MTSSETKDNGGTGDERTGNWTGGCLCGAIRYRASAFVGGAGYCHCRMCQKASGAPVVAWLSAPVEAFAFTDGSPTGYRSSDTAMRHFCGRCGTPLTFRSTADPQAIDINLVTLDHPERVSPQFHIHTASRQPWLRIPDGLPEYTGARTST